jgi:diazepam-binding inhibitor (GABA receptor modulator, acyl-CoA-binding protein)
MLGNIAGVHPDCHQVGIQSRVTGDKMSLKDQFEAAVAASKQLPERPDNMTLLKLYALYKQGSSGDVEDKRPGFTDMVGRAKWDAWNELKGTSNDEAMQQYIDLIESLK